MTKLPSSLADWIKQGDQYRKRRHNRRQRVRIPWLLSYLEKVNRTPNKAHRAEARANLAEMVYRASVPKTRERL